MLGGTPLERPPSKSHPGCYEGVALQGSKGGKGNPLAPSNLNQLENLPTAMHDTEAPVVILKPVEAFVARMPS